MPRRERARERESKGERALAPGRKLRQARGSPPRDRGVRQRVEALAEQVKPHLSTPLLEPLLASSFHEVVAQPALPDALLRSGLPEQGASEAK